MTDLGREERMDRFKDERNDFGYIGRYASKNEVLNMLHGVPYSYLGNYI